MSILGVASGAAAIPLSLGASGSFGFGVSNSPLPGESIPSSSDESVLLVEVKIFRGSTSDLADGSRFPCRVRGGTGATLAVPEDRKPGAADTSSESSESSGATPTLKDELVTCVDVGPATSLS